MIVCTLCSDNGQLTLNEKLPDSITSWVISGFAVKNDSEIAVTANPFEVCQHVLRFCAGKTYRGVFVVVAFSLHVTIWG